MKKRTTAPLLSALLIVIWSSSGLAQVCGDVNNDGVFSSADQIDAFTWFQGGPAPAAPQNADVDGRIGFTIADLQMFFDPGAPAGFSCPPDTAYKYQISLSDTVLFQAVRCLQSSSAITLQVITRFSNEVEGFFLPIQLAGGPSRGAIVSASVSVTGQGPLTVPLFEVGDSSAVLIGTGFAAGDYVGERTMFEINYSLDAADCYTIWPSATDLEFGKLFTVLRGGDLYRPVVVYDITNDCPPGDVNCTCNSNLTDVTLLVNSLFITFEPLDCE